MSGTDYTLRPGHLFLFLLVASSVILGISYLNEMYQRIQLQTEVALVERQTRRAILEKSSVEHKAAQLELKLEALKNEMKRLQESHEFQAQQRMAYYGKEKEELVENISLKNQKITDLQEQYESLKIHFDSHHSVMEEFEKNQSRLLEKFTTQSTQCMNIISMMTALCDKGRDKFRKILPLVKAKNALVSAVKNQSLLSVKKPENNYSVAEGTFPKTQKLAFVRYVMKNIAPNPVSPSGKKERSSTDLKLEVNDLSSEQEKTVILENIQRRQSTPNIREQGLYQNITEQENVTSPDEGPMVSLQRDGNYTVVSKKDLNEIFKFKKITNQTANTEKSEQKPLIYQGVDLDESFQDMEINASYSENVNESEGNSPQLTNASNTATSKDMFAVVEERKLNKKTDIKEKDKEQPLKMNMQNSSHNDVQNTESGNDRKTKETKKYKDIILNSTEKENDEKKIPEMLKLFKKVKRRNQN